MNNMLFQQLFQLALERKEAAGLNLDQFLIAHDVDEIAFQFNFLFIAGLRKIVFQRGMQERSLSVPM